MRAQKRAINNESHTQVLKKWASVDTLSRLSTEPSCSTRVASAAVVGAVTVPETALLILCWGRGK